jgi:hypothetical protein
MDTSRDSDVTWRTVAPISLVTSFAVYGQFQFGLDAFRQDWFPLTVVIAGGAAAAFESISLYVQWHAHDALLRKDTPTAAKYRRWSYLLAGIAATVNYSHFSHGWAPTPAAVMFALFSLSSPWLWGLHTRRAHHIQLSVEGRLDDTGALFSAERWRHFPWRTLGARRWSIDRGITDPRTAWESYRTERARRTGRPTLEQKVALLVAVTRLASPAPKLRQRRDDVTPVVADTNQRSAARAGSNRSPFLENPPAKAIELAQSGLGKARLREAVLSELGTPITHHEARTLLAQYRPTNGHQVTS